MILFKKLLRTAWHYKAQFISMILMIALGMGIFIGFNMEWMSIKKSTTRFYNLTGYSDFRVINTNSSKITGYTKNDLDKVLSIDGIDSATRYFNVTVTDSNKKYDDKNNTSLDLAVIEKYESPMKLVTITGEDYNSNSDGFYLSDKYANIYNYKVGDTLTISYNGISISKEIKALVKSGEHIVCINEDAGQIMPDYSIYGYVFTTPSVLKEMLNKVYPGMGIDEYYTRIMIKSNLETDILEKEIDKAFGVNTFILLDKENSNGYKEPLGEINEGKTMGNILPVIFLAIAVLTMITTMHRIATNEKVQIGTLKALGFKDRRILVHYTSYGLFIGSVGTGLAVLIGILICNIIMNPNGMMGTYFDMDKWPKAIPLYVIIVSILVVILLAFITFLSVKNMLKGSASDALKPYTPKKHKPLVIEGTKAFSKLSFSAKWNLRDVFRNKVRTLMTILGVVGASLLMFASFAFDKTFSKFISTLKSDVMKYNTAVNINSSSNINDVINFAELIDADYSCSNAIKVNDSKEYIQYNVINNTKGLYGVLDKNSNALTLTNEGVYVSQAVIKDDKVKVGDTINIYLLSEEGTKCYKVYVAGSITSFSEKAIVSTEEYAKSLKEATTNEAYEFKISTLYTNKTKDEVTNLDANKVVSSMNTKDEILKTFDSFVEIMDIMIVMLVVFSALLAVVVLYNLGVMSYFERYRHLATLKVVGFKDKHIAKILITQNIWLTLVGIIIGIPLGMFTVEMLVIALCRDYELTVFYGIKSFILTFVIVYATSLIVSLFVARKNKKINMVEALKGAE